MSAYSDAVIADGASHYWRLDETSGTSAADSVGTSPGQIFPGVTLGAPSPAGLGTAMTFASGRISATPAVTVPIVATIEAWINTSAAALQAIFSTRNQDVIGQFVFACYSDGTLAIYADAVGLVTGTLPVNNGAWHHVVCVLDGSTATFYVDGVLGASPAFARTTITSGGVTTSFGADDFGSGIYAGSIDEIALYPLALTPAKILNHHTLGTAIPTTLVTAGTVGSSVAAFAPTLAYALAGATVSPAATVRAPSLAYTLAAGSVDSTAVLDPPSLAYTLEAALVSSTATLFPPRLEGVIVGARPYAGVIESVGTYHPIIDMIGSYES